jgi:type IV pilus assembly protein PilA
MFNSRKEKGFTLVEVIVVAVIVAVLAAVAIPLYMGYIHDSRLNVCNNIGGSVASAAGATVQQGKWNSSFETNYTSGTPVNFPAVDSTAPPNVIAVPEDFTVNVTNSTAQCFYKVGSSDAINGKVFTFKSN